ncbi:hypothetical protein B7P34_05480 [Streptosporangium nondiastaticum]|uniref:Uncharacterized protein n=1 Tax=Streptosporangium nondiastaticum TaxID=35764 RepID=A0A9X7JTR9_9ACTN|nr:hypothetical protein [Streptosporangium nondiastaticum]PSJ29712.1 hypothetical protein B7P34_05480 [Streptosporangium nondiastaticum]
MPLLPPLPLPLPVVDPVPVFACLPVSDSPGDREGPPPRPRGVPDDVVPPPLLRNGLPDARCDAALVRSDVWSLLFHGCQIANPTTSSATSDQAPAAFEAYF